jgi:hypothetical protein
MWGRSRRSRWFTPSWQSFRKHFFSFSKVHELNGENGAKHNRKWSCLHLIGSLEGKGVVCCWAPVWFVNLYNVGDTWMSMQHYWNDNAQSITQSGLLQAHSHFSRQRDLLLPLSVSIISFFPLPYSVAAYVYFLVSVPNIEEKLVLMLLCLPQIPYELAWLRLPRLCSNVWTYTLWYCPERTSSGSYTYRTVPYRTVPTVATQCSLSMCALCYSHSQQQSQP